MAFKIVLVLTLVLNCTVTHAQASSGRQDSPACPTWMYSNGTDCVCGSSLDGVVDCLESEVLLRTCYCMTLDSEKREVVGKCAIGCVLGPDQFHLYNKQPVNSSQLEEVCSAFNKAGQLCGQCREGFGQSAYSYNLACCQGQASYNWIKYLAAAYIPLTCFLIFVLVFRISATFPALHGFVVFSQAVSVAQHIRAVFLQTRNFPSLQTYFKIIFPFYSIWNLDFFRTLLPDICVDSSSVQIITLDYAIAFYPLVLIMLSYCLIQLYARNFKPIVCLWRPFQRYCFSRLRKPLNLSDSLVNAFATFFLLSYTKTINTSFDLLIPSKVYNINGTSMGYYLYYDGSIEYFGAQHTPYGVIAIIVSVCFVLLPMFLLLYPLKCFRRCLNLCRIRLVALHALMDVFHGYYKNGIEPGTRDCRYFAAVYLFLRVLLFLLFSFTQSFFSNFLLLVGCLFTAMLVAVGQPYKKEYNVYNTIDTLFYALLAFCFICRIFIGFGINQSNTFMMLAIAATVVAYTVPIVYISVKAILWMYGRRLHFSEKFKNRCWFPSNITLHSPDVYEPTVPYTEVSI